MEQAFERLAASTKWWARRQPHLTLKYTWNPIFTSHQPPLQITHKIRDRGSVNAPTINAGFIQQILDVQIVQLLIIT